MSAEVGEPLENPCVGGLAGFAAFTAPWVPVGDGGAELGEDELGENVGVDERRKDGGPDVEEGEDGGRFMDVPIVVNCRAHFREPEGEEHGFVVGCEFGLGDEAIGSVFRLRVFFSSDVKDLAKTTEVFEEEERVGERRPGCELLSELFRC